MLTTFAAWRIGNAKETSVEQRENFLLHKCRALIARPSFREFYVAMTPIIGDHAQTDQLELEKIAELGVDKDFHHVSTLGFIRVNASQWTTIESTRKIGQRGGRT